VPNASRSKWFNNIPWNGPDGALAAFTPPSVGQYGNCGTGIIQGPGLWSVNIGLHKSVPLSSKASLKFEANMMNAFNHPNWGNPNVNVSSGAFGEINESINASTPALDPSVTSTNGERHVWMGMRVEF
jgi:hypothetical protein